MPRPAFDKTNLSGLVPANTPNDGLPERFEPVHAEPIIVGEGGPKSGPDPAPSGPAPVFAHTLPLVMQLPSDIIPTQYAGGMGGYRITPPGPQGSPSNIAAAQSANSD